MEQNKNLPDFFIIPSVLYLDKNLHPTDLIVYGYVYWLAKLKLEKCIAKNEFIADALICTDRNIRASIVRLCDGGYLEKIEKNGERELVPLISFGTNVPQRNKRSAVSEQTFRDDNIIRISNKEKEQKKVKTINFTPGTQLCRVKDSSLGCGHCAWCSWTVLSPADTYEIALAKKIPYSFVKRTEQSLINYTQEGKMKDKTFYRTINNWINHALQRGDVHELDFMGIEMLKLNHDPKLKEQMDTAYKKLQEQGVL